MTVTTVTHPAKFSDPIIVELTKLLVDLPGPILDPFAGTGRVHELGRTDTVGVEIESEWADMHERTIVGNALELDFPDNSIGTIVTSPTYGNRMADTYDGRDGSKRYTYRTALGHNLNGDNSGAMQWGTEYRDFHKRAWSEAFRVLAPSGYLILNISDHVRKGQLVAVSSWHANIILELGFEGVPDGWTTVTTKRNRNGANRDLRVDFESIIRFRKPKAVKVVEEAA